jgi:hypothetical protein
MRTPEHIDYEVVWPRLDRRDGGVIGGALLGPHPSVSWLALCVADHEAMTRTWREEARRPRRSAR